jgi:predicted YcjX-like family ATPase
MGAVPCARVPLEVVASVMRSIAARPRTAALQLVALVAAAVVVLAQASSRTIRAGQVNVSGRTAIGIHGTFAEGSIKTAARHGCIRMRIADVEQLFRPVRIGTPIGIHA